MVSSLWNTNSGLVAHGQFRSSRSVHSPVPYASHERYVRFRGSLLSCGNPVVHSLARAMKSPSGLDGFSLGLMVEEGVSKVKQIGLSLFRIHRMLGFLALSILFHGAMPYPANAARSGGRMGGMRSFSSAGSSSMYRSSFSGSPSSRMGLSSSVPRRSSVQTNAFFFSPFGFGFGYGYPMGGGFMSLLFWGVFAAIILQVIRGSLSGGVDDDERGYIGGGGGSYGKLSVAKVQVGLLSNARTLQRDLERIASRADTSSPRGLHFVLQETVLALMRNPDYCIYGFAKSGIEDSPEAAESRFNKLSLEERGKFQKETRVNVSGITNKSSLGTLSNVQSAVGELIVVTILVAAEGRVRLPKTTSRSELKDALSTLGSIPAEDIYAVEVLWTPEEEGDYFTTEDLAYDYPMLNTL